MVKFYTSLCLCCLDLPTTQAGRKGQRKDPCHLSSRLSFSSFRQTYGVRWRINIVNAHGTETMVRRRTRVRTSRSPRLPGRLPNSTPLPCTSRTLYLLGTLSIRAALCHRCRADYSRVNNGAGFLIFMVWRLHVVARSAGRRRRSRRLMHYGVLLLACWWRS